MSQAQPDRTKWLWIGGVLLILAGFGVLQGFPQLLTAPFLIVAGALLLPPVWAQVAAKWPVVRPYSTLIRIFACVLPFAVVSMLMPKAPQPSSSSSPSYSPPVRATSAPPPGASAGLKSAIPADVTYAVLKTDVVPGVKRTLDIRINKIVPADVLRAIALKLKAEDTRTYRRTFMLYYLPGMSPGAGAWASTHSDPDLDVRVLGFTGEQAAEIVAPARPSQDAIGRWIDHAPGFSSQIMIYRETAGKLQMDRKFQDGSSLKIALVEKPSPLGRRFEDVEGSDHGDHFVITPGGDLQMRNTGGLIATAKPAK